MNSTHLLNFISKTLVLVVAISFAAGSSVGWGNQSIIATGHGEFSGLFNGEQKSITFSYVDTAQSEYNGMAHISEGDRNMVLGLDCLINQEGVSFQGIAGTVLAVDGASLDDGQFPKFAPPEVGDYAIFMIIDNGSGADDPADRLSRPFVFPPYLPGIGDIDCDALTNDLSPPPEWFAVPITNGNVTVMGLD